MRPTATAKRARKGITMNTTIITTKSVYFTYDFFNRTIVGTDVNFELAGNPNTTQYAELMERMSAQPTFALFKVETERKVKRTYSGLSRELMFDYLTLHEEQDMLKKFAEMKDDHVAYPAIKSWFLEAYPKFNVEKAKKEVQAARLMKTKVKYKATKKDASKKDASKAPIDFPAKAVNQ